MGVVGFCLGQSLVMSALRGRGGVGTGGSASTPPPSIRVIKDKQTQLNRGFAFIQLSTIVVRAAQGGAGQPGSRPPGQGGGTLTLAPHRGPKPGNGAMEPGTSPGLTLLPLPPPPPPPGGSPAAADPAGPAPAAHHRRQDHQR